MDYGWRRFWASSETSVYLAYDAFLPDWDPSGMRAAGAERLEDLQDNPCLILLGESGIGKTREIVQYQVACATDGTRIVRRIDLAEYGTGAELRSLAFQSEWYSRWCDGDTILELYLDSLDEAAVSAPSIGAALEAAFAGPNLSRLRLRVVCRPGVWPVSLGARLASLWPNTPPRTLRMLPLRGCDVEAALAAHNYTEDGISAFFDELARTRAHAFAAKPVTLELLIRIFKRNNGTLPPTQAEMYRQGCLELCNEVTPERRDVGHGGLLTAEERMLVASRIAVLTLLSGASAVSMAPADRDLDIDRVLGTFAVYTDVRPIIRDHVREALSTGLFAPAGADRIAWSHRSFAEYLAAAYLLRRGIAIKQALGLLSHNQEPSRIVPQLTGVAGWLAALSGDARRIMLKRNPEAVLETDATEIPEAERAPFVTALLESISEGRASAGSLRSHFASRLVHSGLGRQLAPYLDKTIPEETRHAAVILAEACRVQNLSDRLLEIAVDPAEPVWLRRDAIHAAAATGDQKLLAAKLMPLATSLARGRDALEIKAAILEALWPAAMSTGQLVEAVRQDVPDTGFLGSYDRFVTYSVPELIPTSDLALFYRWVTVQPSSQQLSPTVREMIDGVLCRGLAHLDDADIARELARALLSRITVDHAVLGRFGEATFVGRVAQINPDRRQRLLDALIAAIVESNFAPENDGLTSMPRAIRGLHEIVHSTDFNYLRARYSSSQDRKEREAIAWLLFLAWDRYDSDAFNTIFDMWQEDDLLKTIFEPHYRSVDLQSELAEALRRSGDWEKQQREREQRQKDAFDSRIARLPSLLDRIEAGQTVAWVELNAFLEDWPRGQLIIDIPEFPAWKMLTPEVTARIAHAAESYVFHASCPPDVGSHAISAETIAAYRALKLVAANNRAVLNLSSAATAWAKWADLLVRSPLAFTDDGEIAEWLRCTVFEWAPAEARSAFASLLKTEGASSAIDWIFAHFKPCRSDTLAGVFMAEVENKDLRPENVCAVLSELFRRRCGDIEALCSRLTAQRETELKRAVAGAVALVVEQRGSAWRRLWNDWKQDTPFLRRILVCLVGKTGVEFLTGLNALEIAELYDWTSGIFPPSRYRDAVGGEAITDRHRIAQFRDMLPQVIANSGVTAAVEVLKALAGRHPDQPWLGRLVHIAARTTLERTWAPIAVADLAVVLADAEKRYVASPAHFLEVITESLDRLNAEFQGTPPGAQFLWDTTVNEPKDEESLSDYVAMHLRRDLHNRKIIANREVQFTRRIGGSEQEFDGDETGCALTAGVISVHSAVCETAN